MPIHSDEIGYICWWGLSEEDCWWMIEQATIELRKMTAGERGRDDVFGTNSERGHVASHEPPERDDA